MPAAGHIAYVVEGSRLQGAIGSLEPAQLTRVMASLKNWINNL
jgi:hypothetical protein